MSQTTTIQVSASDVAKITAALKCRFDAILNWAHHRVDTQ